MNTLTSDILIFFFFFLKQVLGVKYMKKESFWFEMNIFNGCDQNLNI